MNTRAVHPAPTARKASPQRDKRHIPTDRQLLLTGRQVETLTGIPYRTLYDWATSGKVATVNVPTLGSMRRRLWFRRSDIEALINTQLAPPAAKEEGPLTQGPPTCHGEIDGA